MKTWGYLARRHKGTEVKPVNGESRKIKRIFFVALCEKKDLLFCVLLCFLWIKKGFDLWTALNLQTTSFWR